MGELRLGHCNVFTKKYMMVWVRAGLHTICCSQENTTGMGEHRFIHCNVFTIMVWVSIGLYSVMCSQ